MLDVSMNLFMVGISIEFSLVFLMCVIFWGALGEVHAVKILKI
jgi:hypothetical protein